MDGRAHRGYHRIEGAGRGGSLPSTKWTSNTIHSGRD